MKLRKLALQGYKTFASKTEFVFDGGITAIVGPNGSGKSNIADALRWVLGEQSYSILRGKRTTDMIFAGSRHRARAGMAQVTITLDNSDNWLPIDYAEVEIARRAHRSGENEYLLNGQHVRLRDITQLLATSGLAERTYTIIGQGMVDQALSLRSDERRALFEEAAGINHYKQRRAETLRRLEETERNLQRVHDILAELRPRLSSLKRQAQRTQHYEQISADLRELLRFWYGFKWEQAKSDLRLARQAAAAAESGWEQSRAELLRLQEQADRLQQRMNELQQQIVASRAARDSLREQLELSRRDRAILRERREAVQRQIAEIEQDLPLLLDQQTIAQAEVASAADDLAAAQEQLAEQQERRRQFQESSQTRREEIARRQQALRRAEDDLRRRRTAAAQAQGQLSQLRERLAEAGGSEEDDRVEGELAGLAEEIARHEATAASAQDALNDLRRRRGEEQRLRREQIEQLKGMRRELREREDGLSRRQHELARLEERVNLLEQSRHRSAPAVPPEQIVGQLVGLLHIPATYETAITAALGERLSAWVLADQEALWASIREARRRTEESATALLLAALGRSGNGRVTGAEARPALPSENGVIGWADEVVNWESNLTSLASRLLGSLLLVEDEATAYRLAETLPPGHLVVTPDGFVAHTDGLIELHRPRPSGALNREAEWRAGQAKLESVRVETAERETAVRELRAAIERLQTEVDKRQEEERQLDGPENEAGQQMSEAQRKVERARQQVGYLRRQQETQAAERRRLDERIEQTETLLREHEAALEQLEAQVNEAGAGLAALPVNETQQQQEAQQQAVMAAQTVVAGRQAVVDSRRATLSQIDNQLGRLRQRLTHLGEQMAQLRRDEETATSRSLEEELAALDAAIDPLQAELNAGAQALARLQEETAVRQRHAHELENQYTQQRVRLAQLESQVAGLQERIRADLGLVALSYDAEQTGPTPLPMHDVVDQLPQVEELPPDIEETINQYRGQLHRMGPINPDAPAELAEVEERYDFLSRQVEDLTAVDARLRQVIAELDDLTSRAFAETVEKVNSVFDETFRQLFGGGSGRLVVTDPDDLTRSGVEIVARLPNRREQALALLSGGERSLTAAALIFSLLRVSPPPFCVLDEVDAALDEANINRFRDLVSELSRQIQFVLITHNRGTVQAAATIYGVSMQPDSASQVISIKPEEYARE